MLTPFFIILLEQQPTIALEIPVSETITRFKGQSTGLYLHNSFFKARDAGVHEH